MRRGSFVADGCDRNQGMSNITEFFDFFHIRHYGNPPEALTVELSNGEQARGRLIPGVLEDFSFGWSVETTYGIYRARSEALLDAADKQEATSTLCQALLSCVVVLTVSGLETLVVAAAAAAAAGSPVKRPTQSIDEFIRIVEGLDGYKPIESKDRAPLGRLFDVRHAIVHYGWRVTSKLQGRVDHRVPVQKEVFLDPGNVRKVLQVADRFAEGVRGCFPSDLSGTEVS